MNPTAWRGLRYPDSDLVGLVYRFARPELGGDSARSARAGDGAQPEHGGGGEPPVALDVGCGPGRHTKLLADMGYRAIGLDSDEAMCACARENGVDTVHVDVRTYRPAGAPRLVVCWGFMMLVPEGPALVAAWRPKLVIADWRDPENSCFHWPGNERLTSGGVRLRQAKHVLDGQVYFAHTLEQCVIPGYERLHWQCIVRETAGERNSWYQTVHRRL